jgi:hypothetical protein
MVDRRSYVTGVAAANSKMCRCSYARLVFANASKVARRDGVWRVSQAVGHLRRGLELKHG